MFNVEFAKKVSNETENKMQLKMNYLHSYPHSSCVDGPLPNPSYSMLKRLQNNAIEQENKMQLELLDFGLSERNIDVGG